MVDSCSGTRYRYRTDFLCNVYRYFLFLFFSYVRTRLENVILKVKVLGCSQLPAFLSLLLDPPSQLAVDLAVQALKDIGALNVDGMHNAPVPVADIVGQKEDDKFR